MKVQIIKPIAHCSGVINAINMAKKAVKKHPDKNIYLFGWLVHNQRVITDLEAIGIKTIDVLEVDPIERLKQFTKDDFVILPAHGHPIEYENILKEKGVEYIDTTCPKVTECFKRIKEAKEVIYIGREGHPEAMSAITMNENVHFYDVNKREFDYDKVEEDEPLVINQTTLTFYELKEIQNDILKHLPYSNIVDDICDAAYYRQKAIAGLKDNIDAIIIIGSTKSSNTIKLHELALEMHPRKKILLVENLEELKTHTLDFKHVALCSGTSTPMEEITEIHKYLRSL